MKLRVLLSSVTLAAAIATAAPPLVPPAEAAAAARAALAVTPAAAKWKTILVGDAARHLPGPPPAPGSEQARAELAELLAWQNRRTGPDQQAIGYWSRYAAVIPWSKETRDLLIREGAVPPRAARAMAHVHAAMYDATVIAWMAKAKYGRPAPSAPGLKPLLEDEGIPSYPSEHAAAAFAAVEVLAHLYPTEAEAMRKKAALAAETRIAGGGNTRSDVEAGKAIGEVAAQAAIARLKSDGGDAVAKLPLETRPGQWTHVAPMEPLAGTWKPWFLAKGSQFRPAKPAAPGTPIHKALVAQVVAAQKKLTPEQIKLAKYWNFDVPAIMWNDLVMPDIERRMDSPNAAKTLAMLNMIEADTAIACWDGKYAHRELRPIMVAKGFKSIIMTPPHPSFPAGHASFSIAAATYMSSVFPDRTAYYREEALTAATSRLWGGIHYTRDNEAGLVLGKRVATHAMREAKKQGLQ